MIVAVFFIITLLMTNPPVVNWVSAYAEENPLLFGWPYCGYGCRSGTCS